MPKFCLFSLVGQWALFNRFGPLLLSTRGAEIGRSSVTKQTACQVEQQAGTSFVIAARVLATYLIPGCVGREVRLGSENSSGGGAGGGVWKSGNLEIWELGYLGIWRPGDLEIWILEIWGRGIQKIGVGKFRKNHQNSNPFCPKCRQGLD